MPKKLRSPFEHATGRLKLAIRKRPYWIRLGPGLSLGCRRNEGPSSWVPRTRDGETTIGIADDYEPANGTTVLSYDQAVAVARKSLHGDDAKGPTKLTSVSETLNAYEADLLARGANPYNAQQPRVHLTPSLLNRPVTLTTEKELKDWRNNLIKKGMKAAAFNRMRNSILAAVQPVASHRLHGWKAGLEKLPDTQSARNVVPARRRSAGVGSSHLSA